MMTCETCSRLVHLRDHLADTNRHAARLAERLGDLQEREERLSVLLRVFVTFHSGHVLLPELGRTMTQARHELGEEA